MTVNRYKSFAKLCFEAKDRDPNEQIRRYFSPPDMQRYVIQNFGRQKLPP